MALDGKITIGTRVDETGLNTGLGDVTKALKGLKGTVAALGIGAALAKEFERVTRATQDFQAGLAKASTLFGDVAVDTDNLATSIRKISASTGADMGELGEAIYSALSAGVAPSEDMAEVLSLVEKSSKLAKGGFTDVDTALSATVKTMNAYGMTIQDVDRIQNVLLQTQNLGITTVDELGASLSQVVPTASAFGVSFEELGGALATMTAAGTPTAQAVTQLNTLFAELGKSGTEAAKNLKEAASDAGISADSFAELKESGYELPQILEMMSKYAEKSGLSMVDMFSSIEAGRAALMLTGEQSEKFNKSLASMKEGTNLVEGAFGKVVKPTERLSNAISSLEVKLGRHFAPTAGKATTQVANFLEKMAGTRTRVDDFSDALDDIIAKYGEYQEATEKAVDAQDELTRAMEGSSYAAYISALRSIGDEYEKSVKSIDKAEKKLYGDGGLYDALELRRRSLQEIAGEGRDVAEVYNEIISLGEGATRAQLDYVGEYENYLDILEAISVQEKIVSEEQNKFTFEIRKGAEAVMNGKLQLEDLKSVSVEFGNAVEEMIGQLDQEQGGIQDAREEWERYTFVTEEGLAVLIEENKALAEKSENARVVAYANEMVALAEKKLAELTDTATESIEDNTEAVEKNRKTMNNHSSSVRDVIDSYMAMDKTNEALGYEFYSQEEKLSSLESGYASLIREGVDPTLAVMGRLKAEIISLKKEIADKKALEDADRNLDEHKKTVMDVAKQVGAMRKVNRSLGYEMYSQEDVLSALRSGYATLIEEGVDPASVGMEWLREQIASVNAELEKKKLVESYTDSLASFGETFSSIFESIAEGEEVWASFAKAGLNAIAKIVEALGHELAGEAAVAFVNGKYGTASITTAKALAAYAAAGLIKGWAGTFATGGIVKGSYTGGDNLTASVKAGEVILNHAQAINTAKMLEAIEKLSSASGATVIQFNGPVYGDKEQIAVSVYDKIKTLQGEGRLERW